MTTVFVEPDLKVGDDVMKRYNWTLDEIGGIYTILQVIYVNSTKQYLLSDDSILSDSELCLVTDGIDELKTVSENLQARYEDYKRQKSEIKMPLKNNALKLDCTNSMYSVQLL
jgi:hypothetical protein